MKVFLSWSKGRSRTVAVALKSWLPKVIQSCEPWMSEKDVLAGQQWDAELTQRLDESSIGILCVTQENYREPWLNFEAGAISKKVGAARQNHVAPFLLGFERPEDLPPPLGRFQSKLANKEGTFELLQMINSTSDKPLAKEALREQFEMWWPSLEKELQKAAKMSGGEPVRRPDGEKLDELLSLTRTLLNQFENRPLYGKVDEHSGERASRSSSRSEAFLYKMLQQRPTTMDLFTLNAQVEVGDGVRSVEVDLLCRELKLAVEIDGYFHFRDFDAFRRDRRKDVLLQRTGYWVVRFLEEDVVDRLDELLDTLDTLIAARRREATGARGPHQG